MLLPSIFGNDFFEDFMNFPGWDRGREPHRHPRRGGQAWGGLWGLMPTDVKEDENGYELHIDLPGFRKEDVKASLKDGYLTVEANRSSETEEKKKFLRQERYVGQMARSFYVGDLLTEADITARFENGVLMLTIPKKEETPKVEEKRYIAIEG